MKSFGKKNGGEVTMEKENVYYPAMTLNQEQLPDLKGKDVDDMINLHVKAKICGISKHGNGEIDYRLDIHEGEIMGKKKEE